MRLGPFELAERLGRGGMAEVFAGRHEGQGVDVAVKLLRVHDHAHATTLTSAFRREAERLAALDHPSIVTVLDAGTLPEALVHREGRFEAGTPYFVMERASRSLDALGRPLAWREVVDVAHALLDALAHAHARGFVHRDLKPGNVLVHDGGHARSPIQLGDFGIAHAPDGVGAELLREGLVGTPGFMAPEQIRGQFRDLGPWTDLYALGVTLHVLLTGVSPFLARTPQQLLVAQLAAERLPALPASIEAPPALQGFLFAATEVDPRRRLRRAADAARLLLGLGPRSSTAPRARVDGASPTAQPTLAIFEGSLAHAPTVLAELPFERRASGSVPPPRIGGTSGSLPPDLVPSTWRTPGAKKRRLALVGAGLSLYGVRAIPLAGRRADRDALWTALGATVRDRRAGVIHLRGTSGVGKTRLAQWLGVRAHELGVAEVLVARHGPERGAFDGLRSAFVRHHACADLGEGQLSERLRARLHLDDRFDLATVVRYLAAAASPGARVATDAGNDLHALRLLLTQEARPWVVVVDDVQWADEAAAAIAALVGEPLPVLFVTTEQAGAPGASSGALASLDRALRASRGRALELGPLSEDEHHTLVEELLRLEPSLARRIALRTAGSPLFAVELVGDWVRRGKLVVGEGGFELAPGADFELPDDLHAVWLERVAGLIGDDARRGTLLELSAMLGGRVALAEWTRAAGLIGEEGVESLALEMLREGLFVREPDAPEVVRFVHGLLRESLLRRAREHDRSSALARAVAELLEVDAARGTAGAAERLARHYLSHPTLGDAHPWLLRGAAERRTGCEFAAALALLDEAAAISKESVVSPRTAPALLLRSWTLRLASDFPRALAAAERVLFEIGRPELAPFAAEAHLRRADVDVRIGRVDRACEDLEVARAGFAAVGDVQGFGVATWVRAWIDVFRGELVAPVDALEVLRERLDRPTAPPPGATHVLWALAYAFLARGDLLEAERTYEAAEVTATRFHNRLAVAHIRAGQAQLARLRGDPLRAHELAESSLEVFRLLGASETHFGELALGLSLADLGRFDDALQVLETSAEDLRITGRSGFAARTSLFAALVRVRAGDELGAAPALASSRAVVEEVGLREALLAREARVARSCARDAVLVEALERCAATQLATPFFQGVLPSSLVPDT